ncbi:hypothetical protein EAE99_010767 [Botrytis elliptica]|nr:hypothetical protein EAE99_010767 [Botrytis elliptica]
MDGLKPAISSMSLGRAWIHSMPSKLSAASTHHIHGLEIFYEDLEDLARTSGIKQRDPLSRSSSPCCFYHKSALRRTKHDHHRTATIFLLRGLER